MVSKIKTIARIINMGNSIGITISKDVRALLKLQKGDYIQLTIEKINLEDVKKP